MNNRQLSWTKKYNNNHFIIASRAYFQQLRNKYVGQKVVSQAYWKPGDSHFWAGLMAAKKHIFRFESFAIKDGVGDSFLGRHLARQCQSQNNIQPYITLLAIRTILLRTCSVHPRRTFRLGGIWLAPDFCHGIIFCPGWIRLTWHKVGMCFAGTLLHQGLLQ